MSAYHVSPQREELAGRLPLAAQPFVTWLSGIRGARERRGGGISSIAVIGLGVLSILAGLALIALALATALPIAVPLYLLGVGFVAGGMRRLDVLVIHQSLHYKVLKTPRANRILGEVLTTLLLRTPYRQNQKSHLMHHRAPCAEEDDDVLFLRDAGLPLQPDRRTLYWRVLGICLSPRFHARFLADRLRVNFIEARPVARLAMSWAYAGLLLAPGLVYGADYLIGLGLFWIVPLTVGFHISNFLYTATKHRWWVFSNRVIREQDKKDLLSFTRVCCSPAPEGRGAGAWGAWWLKALLIHLPVRLFVVVGDTVHHDLHHIAPNCDWPNSTDERALYAARTPQRFSEVWGGLGAHLKECNLREDTGAAGARPVAA